MICSLMRSDPQCLGEGAHSGQEAGDLSGRGSENLAKKEKREAEIAMLEAEKRALEREKNLLERRKSLREVEIDLARSGATWRPSAGRP